MRNYTRIFERSSLGPIAVKNIKGVEDNTIIYRDGNSHYIVVEYPYMFPNERVDPKKFYNTVNKVTDALLKNGNTITSIVHDSSADMFIIFYS